MAIGIAFWHTHHFVDSSQSQSILIEDVFLFSLLCFGGAVIGYTVNVFITGVLHPLETLQAAANAVAQGDFSHTIPIHVDDEIGGLCRTFNDMIAKRKQAEEALRQSEERWRVVQDFSLDGFMILRSVRDDQGKIIDFDCEYLNPAAAIMFDHVSGGPVGARLLTILPGNKSQSELFDHLVIVADTGASHPLELFYDADGVHGWFRCMLVRLGDGVAVSWANITEQKQMEEALVNSEQHFRSILDGILDIIAMWDANGVIRYVSPSIHATLGYEPTELIGRKPIEFIHPQDLSLFQDASSRMIHDHSNAEFFQFRALHKDGSWRFCAAASKNLLADPLISGILISCRDITEQRQLESQLVLARKMESIGQLAAGIAHEINTPMQYIGDNGRFLQDAFADMTTVLQHFERLLEAVRTGAVPPALVSAVETAMAQADLVFLQEEIPSALEQLLQGVERVSKIVRAMKEFSHPGTEHKTATDINKAIETTVTVARNEWKYVAEVETDFDPRLPLVPCFAGELNQVLLNLLVNAAHAIADVVARQNGGKGVITLSTHTAGDWAEIRIRDTGTGIPEEARAKIFDPFFTTKEVGKGTGQGLAIAHSIIVHKHGGVIDFETVMGEGTTFILRLPLVPSDSSREGLHETTHSLC